ncbi:1,4-beta-xylanase [Lentzea aerocolonigenes]|uniref:1,4-beta-xylanase n=1 Tax=Lentzea aerocolonigenes TaxID=68170 RepID=A0A0F0H011_LENAE|nr:RICIN domain-containing protein [Lentzea aerocolonigenes]KJK48166.1 1,4-beta-xylanase [Lentzea aerocolonigenes]
MPQSFFKRAWKLLAAVGLVAAATSITAPAEAAAPFKVLAFYSEPQDQAHRSFSREANVWFPQQSAANGYTYTATKDWNLLTNITPGQYQVVMFLDDKPHTQQQYEGFKRYLDAGGAFFGFHVSGYSDAEDQPYMHWYHYDFLGSGHLADNSWAPTAETLRIENHGNPATANLPDTILSSASEWYAWEKNIRQNPNITVLASLDASTFPVGDNPGEIWYSGDYPIIWTNKNYKMLYANFGHNKMNYATDTALSSTFESAQQNKLILDGLRGLGGGTTDPGGISPTAWYPVVNKANGKCVDARAAGSSNGTVIQQYSCNGTTAQQFRFQPTSGGYTRADNRTNAALVLDVSGVSLADNAGVQLWTYGGGNNQQWQPVSEGGGYYHLVARHSGKCLTVPGGSGADEVQLVQAACNGGAAQSFRIA